MALTATSWYFLISGLVLSFFALAYAVIMARTFYKKRTLGTAFLTFAFTLLGLGETLNVIAYWFGAYQVTSANTIGILQFLFVNLYTLSLLFFYFFSTRHILRDNDFVKSLMGVFFGELIAVITVVLLSELLFNFDIGFSTIEIFVIKNTTISIYTPNPFLALVLYAPLLIFILIRVSWNLLIIRRKITDPVAKTGISYIGLSVVSMIGSTFVLIIMHVPTIYAYTGVLIFLQTLRVISTIARLITGYLGWILPDWLKRRIRGKTWIAKTLKSRAGEKITYSYSSSQDTDTHSIQVKEISER